MSRRALLLPDGPADLKVSRIVNDVSALVAPGMNVRTDLLGVGEVMTTAVRDEWPFLARLALSSWGDPGVPARPALFYPARSQATWATPPSTVRSTWPPQSNCWGVWPRSHICGVENAATASTVGRGPSQSDWGNKFSILVGDLLLAKALQLAERGGPAALEAMSDAITTVCTGQAARE